MKKYLKGQNAKKCIFIYCFQIFKMGLILFPVKWKQQVSHKPGKPGLGQAAMLPDLFNHQPSFSQEAKIKKTAEVNNCDGATLVSTADMIEY